MFKVPLILKVYMFQSPEDHTVNLAKAWEDFESVLKKWNEAEADKTW